MKGSLATRTGPAGSDRWSVEKLQHAHVGERVEFQFIVMDAVRGVPMGNMADYAVWDIGGTPEVTSTGGDGRFHLSYTFEESATGNVAVRATAYRARGSQDVHAINGQLVELANPNDLPDAQVASDEIALSVYQAAVRFDVPDRTPEYLWATALLTFQTGDNVSTVRPARPGRPGFAIIHDDTSATTVVTFTPTADLLPTTGSTAVRLLVHDAAGEQQVLEQMVPTP